jgi:hypothetical protein
MDPQRLYITFRNIYESVPKYEKPLFLRMCRGVATALIERQPEFRQSAVAQSVRGHFELGLHRTDDGWWSSVRSMVETPFFQAVMQCIRPTYCVHKAHDPRIQFCATCLPAPKFDTLLCNLK